MRFVTYAEDISLVCPFKGSKTGEVLFKYYIKVLNFSLFKQVTRLVYLKAVGTMDASTARQTSKGTFRCVNSLVHSLSEKPHVSVHSIFPDI